MVDLSGKTEASCPSCTLVALVPREWREARRDTRGQMQGGVVVTFLWEAWTLSLWEHALAVGSPRHTES